jgi:predicted phage baseplate assembly protein
VRVHWRREDALRAAYVFALTPPSGVLNRSASLFYGNLIDVDHGRLVELVFRDPSEPVGGRFERHYQRTRWGAVCPLPSDSPLLYRDTPLGGVAPPVSTAAITVVTDSGADSDWRESIDLVHSGPEHRHFVVETDELLRSRVRFGNGSNGAPLPAGAEVHCAYQSGEPLDGNVGADQITVFDSSFTEVLRCWNPFDVTSGRAPEPAAEVRRNAPEAFRAHQLRAVTLADYRRRAEEVAGVSRAAARYGWTGSWRTVRVSVDAEGTDLVEEPLLDAVARRLEPVRMIGEDIEVRPARYVAVVVTVRVCIASGYWPADVRMSLEYELSDGHTPDGRRGLFHPDEWTFGQTLHASDVAARVLEVTGVGVEHVADISLARYAQSTTGNGQRIELRANEIIRVRNDPDHMERGYLDLELIGGRR